MNFMQSQGIHEKVTAHFYGLFEHKINVSFFFVVFHLDAFAKQSHINNLKLHKGFMYTS